MKSIFELKKTADNSSFKNPDFYVKLAFTILFVAFFIISFFALNGYEYFYSTVYADEFKGFDFQVHAIDVGQGDCFLIKLPSNKCMLIDAGEEEYSYKVSEYIRQFLNAEKLSGIDYVVLTHPDGDHIGGARQIIREFEVATLFRPPVYSYSESKMPEINGEFAVDLSLIYDNTINCAYENGLEIKFFEQGDKLDFYGCTAEFLSPSNNTGASNDLSAVIMFCWQNKKFLFMGDAESNIEQQLINQYGEKLKADVLKVGHHGSITSSSQEFIQYVNPSYAIISSGGNSKYFPNPTVLTRLESQGAKVLSTAKEGNFVVSVANSSIIYSKASRPPNHVALIFSIVLIMVLIVWENPFKNHKALYFTKKAS